MAEELLLTEKKMFCSKCGASNSDEAKFCESCGNQLKQIQPQTDNLNSNGNGTVPSAPNQVANPSAPSIIVNVSNNQQNQGVGAALGGLVNPAVLPGPKNRAVINPTKNKNKNGCSQENVARFFK